MKKIEAIVRKTKFEEVKETLHESGIEFFSFWEARGVGITGHWGSCCCSMGHGTWFCGVPLLEIYHRCKGIQEGRRRRT